ncbi:MAG: sensor histidine kinase, partial [Pseudomonadota bacterium]|nr:sensor histidine kinase [Pseudomonadota bacterium]
MTEVLQRCSNDIKKLTRTRGTVSVSQNKISPAHIIGLVITSNGLCIFDDGKKISKNENEKIFEKGFRGSAAKKKDGTGVGLFLARKLAKQIGGDLRLL